MSTVSANLMVTITVVLVSWNTSLDYSTADCFTGVDIDHNIAKQKMFCSSRPQGILVVSCVCVCVCVCFKAWFYKTFVSVEESKNLLCEGIEVNIRNLRVAIPYSERLWESTSNHASQIFSNLTSRYYSHHHQEKLKTHSSRRAQKALGCGVTCSFTNQKGLNKLLLVVERRLP